MFKLTALLYVIIAPTLMGILVVGVLAMSSPTAGGTLVSQEGMTLLMVVIGAMIASVPISYVVAGMINRAMNS